MAGLGVRLLAGAVVLLGVSEQAVASPPASTPPLEQRETTELRLPPVAETERAPRVKVRFELHPTLRLQPESARLTLSLPPELLPVLEPLPIIGLQLTGTIKQWDFQLPPLHLREGAKASAMLGAGFRLVVDDRLRAVRFRMSVLPRAAVAEISF